VDYRIRMDPAELDSTGYMEIGPGRYAGSHWQPGFLFVWEDTFGMAEGIVTRHLPEYDHFGVNDIPRATGLAVIAEWRAAAAELPNLNESAVHRRLNLDASYRMWIGPEIARHRNEMVGLLRELADECEAFYGRGAWICVLGM
jgi:hypothetical protein